MKRFGTYIRARVGMMSPYLKDGLIVSSCAHFVVLVVLALAPLSRAAFKAPPPRQDVVMIDLDDLILDESVVAAKETVLAQADGKPPPAAPGESASAP
ncbi:MAG: hypothetical protein LBH41_00640, partial [Rickettsiales bacterium]|nr:hypothetical protein [Rickettsiales bacterium]